MALKAYTCVDKGLALVGVSDGHCLNVWRGTDELPSVTVNVRASEGEAAAALVCMYLNILNLQTLQISR